MVTGCIHVAMLFYSEHNDAVLQTGFGSFVSVIETAVFAKPYLSNRTSGPRLRDPFEAD